MTAITRTDEQLDLTEREAQVLAHVSSGMTNKEIARRLGISPHTVSNHMRNISRKAGGARRSALVASLAMLPVLR